MAYAAEYAASTRRGAMQSTALGASTKIYIVWSRTKNKRLTEGGNDKVMPLHLGYKSGR